MDEHSLPGVYASYLVELVKRWRVKADNLLAGSGIRPEALSDPRLRIPTDIAVGILERARALTGEPALGFFLGSQLRLSAHGFLGIAALSASTMRESIDLAIQFMPIVTTAIGLRLRVEGREASIIVEEHADFGSARDIVLLAVLTSMSRIGQGMTGRNLLAYADLALPKPAYYRHLPRVGFRVRFDQPVHRLLFDSSQLALPYTMGDPVALRRARDECERILDSLDGTGRTSARVRELVYGRDGSLTSVEKVATALHLSSRTLKRQLAAEGTSFSALVDDERRQRAILMLSSRTVPLKEIAGSLGYANVANFSRAFQRWTGRTPSEHRQSNDAGHRK